jgi:hypothetical protein
MARGRIGWSFLSTYLCMADAWISFRPPYVSDKGDYTQAAQDEIDDSV